MSHLRSVISRIGEPYRFAIMLNLTYDNKNLPVYERLDDDIYISNRDDAAILSKTYFEKTYNIELPQSVKITNYKKDDIDRLPHLHFPDFTKAIRKFNIELKQEFGFKTTPFSYYCRGEYGYKTYRPHYHALVFTNDERVAAAFVSRIHSYWPFDISDGFSRSQSFAAYAYDKKGGYIANYAIGSEVPLPHLGKRPFRCKSVHSIARDTERVYKLCKELVECVDRGMFDGYKVVDRYGNTSLLPFPKYIQTTLFPPLRGVDALPIETQQRICQIFGTFNNRNRWHYRAKVDRFFKDYSIRKYPLRSPLPPYEAYQKGDPYTLTYIKKPDTAKPFAVRDFQTNSEFDYLCAYKIFRICRSLKISPARYIELRRKYESLKSSYYLARHYSALSVRLDKDPSSILSLMPSYLDLPLKSRRLWLSFYGNPPLKKPLLYSEYPAYQSYVDTTIARAQAVKEHSLIQ